MTSPSRQWTIGRPDRRSVLAGLAAAALAGASGVRALPRPATPDLGRGLNLSHWFAQSFEGYGAQHLTNFVRDDALATIAAAGFSHVRLPVEPNLLFGAGDVAPRPEIIRQLAAAIERIQAKRLSVVFDLHPVGSDKDGLRDEKGANLFVERWKRLASAFVATGLADLTLEILNEPEPNRGETWWRLQGRALGAIRSAGATGQVIVNGGGWSGVDDLVANRPYDDAKLVYTVHCYTPLLFTHQGADWTWEVARDIAGVGWPLSRADASKASASVANERSRGFLKSAIASGDFESDALTRQFDQLSGWSRQHGQLPIYIGEFGVYAKAAPSADRLRWIETVRQKIEAQGWGWALWDASPGFGLRRADDTRFALDTDMLQALGLKAG